MAAHLYKVKVQDTVLLTVDSLTLVAAVGLYQIPVLYNRYLLDYFEENVAWKRRELPTTSISKVVMLLLFNT